MKKVTISIIIFLFSSSGFSQTASTSTPPIQNVSTDSGVVFRLFATRNMYNFIKLNTRNGQMWQVQWGTENKYRFETTLSVVSRVNQAEERNGRFFLYPTTNMYNFIMLDQIDGRAWQVQWSMDADERAVIAIY